MGKNFVAYLNRGLGIFLIWDFNGIGIWKIVTTGYFRFWIDFITYTISLLLPQMANSNTIVVNCNCFKHLYTKIRNKDTNPIEWKNAAQRIMTVCRFCNCIGHVIDVFAYRFYVRKACLT